MNQTQTTSHSVPPTARIAHSYYALLGLHPSASPLEIRRAYRELSKCYHPDTTTLSPEVAKAKFLRLNEAYNTLSHPHQRTLYDYQIGYSRLNVIQAPKDLHGAVDEKMMRSGYLDPTDRPLSSGEIFALFTLGLTFVGCLLLVILISFLRGDSLLPEAISLASLLSIFNS